MSFESILIIPIIPKNIAMIGNIIVQNPNKIGNINRRKGNINEQTPEIKLHY